LTKKRTIPLVFSPQRRSRTFVTADNKDITGCRRRHFPRKNGLERYDLAVKNRGLISVLLDRGSIQIDSGEKPSGTRVGKSLSLHLPVSTRCSLAAHRTRGTTDFSTKFELARQKVVHSFLIHHQHDQVDRLAT
jgi:hypothetical protein